MICLFKMFIHNSNNLVSWLCLALADKTEFCEITCRVNTKTQIRAWQHEGSEDVKFISPAYSCSVTHFNLSVKFVTLCYKNVSVLRLCSWGL